MNQVLVDALRRGLGVDGELWTNGLERFAGTMADQSGEEKQYWEKFLKEELNQIHPEGWQ